MPGFFLLAGEMLDDKGEGGISLRNVINYLDVLSKM